MAKINSAQNDIQGADDPSLEIAPSLTDFAPDGEGGGKSGEAGVIALSNAEFCAEVFTQIPENAVVAICHKAGNPAAGGWPAKKFTNTPASVDSLNGHDADNNYVNCSTFTHGDDGSFKARKANFAACHFVYLDDIGTKIPFERVKRDAFSWLIETSPGNHQGGIRETLNKV